MYTLQTILTTPDRLAHKRPVRPAEITAALAIALATGFFSMTNTAEARPEMASSNATARFEAMDVDKDGKVTRKEFFDAQPQMKDTAYLAIDANKDEAITLEEWKNFSMGHASGEAKPGGMPSGMMGGMPAGMMGGMPAESMGNGTSEHPANNATAPAKSGAPSLIMPSSSAK